MSRKKKPTEMKTKELAKATAEFDQEFVADTFDEPDADAKKRWKRAKHKRGRPVRGEGAVRISVTIEKGVLRRVDEFVEKTGQSRSQLIEKGLQGVLKKSGT